MELAVKPVAAPVVTPGGDATAEATAPTVSAKTKPGPPGKPGRPVAGPPKTGEPGPPQPPPPQPRPTGVAPGLTIKVD
jgi:hypothetical protein